MNILAADDERIALEDLMSNIRAAKPDCNLHGFRKTQEVLTFARNNSVDVAFLDIEMPGVNGLHLAKSLKEINPKTNIIFVTGYNQYAVDAFSLRCSGYVLKPATRSEIKRELEHLRDPLVESSAHIRIRTFGNFEVFVDSRPVHFGRSKSKEVLAYLVDRKGAAVTTAEIAGILWEDKQYDRSQQFQMQTIIREMINALKLVGAESMVIRKRNSLSVDITQFECDYYNFQYWQMDAVNAFEGEYMSQYGWAEFKIGYLEKQYQTMRVPNEK